MIIFVIFVLLMDYCCGDNSLSEVLTRTNTHIYFLLGTQAARLNNVQSFIQEMSLDNRHIDFIKSYRKEKLLELNQLNFWKHRNFITEQWIQRYITGVDDPKSVDKNLGRLALMLTLQNAMVKFIKSPYTSMLVFEDDVMINMAAYNNMSARSALSKMINLPQTEWHMQYLGFCFECGNRTAYVAPPVLDTLYTTAVFPLCKHAILLSREMVQLFLTVHTPINNNKGDWIFHDVACKYNLKVLRVSMPIFNQKISNKMESSLGNHNDKRAFARWVSCTEERRKCTEMRNHSGIIAHGLNTWRTAQRV